MRVALAALATLIAASPVQARERADLLIRGASVVDVGHGRIVPRQAVAVRGNTIVAVGPDRAISKRFGAKRTINAAGKFVMPGLWDMHVHFGGGPELIAENKALLPLYVAYGITTVRDCAADISASVLEWRAAVAAKGVYVTPTLNMGRILAFLDREDHSRDEGLAYIGPGLRKTYEWRIERAAKATPEEVAARHKEHELSMKVLPMLQAAGIPILAGTDAGYLNSFNYPGEGLHDELELYVKAGLTPQQALASSVLTGPRFLGHADRYGAVQTGKAADLLILNANPLKSVGATRKISAVLLHGRLLDRAALDKLLAQAKARASR